MELLKEFQIIPGVGPNIAQDIVDLGYKSVEELRGENPGTMYKKLMSLRGTPGHTPKIGHNKAQVVFIQSIT